ALLGVEGRGFEVAQSRLAGGRLHHAMRAIGVAQRAIDLMARGRGTSTGHGCRTCFAKYPTRLVARDGERFRSVLEWKAMGDEQVRQLGRGSEHSSDIVELASRTQAAIADPEPLRPAEHRLAPLRERGEGLGVVRPLLEPA